MALGFGTQPVSALQSLAAGQDVYARDILQGANRQRQMTQAQAQGDVRGLIGQGANPFAAQRQAGRQRFQAQAQNTVATNNALGQRFNTLNQQADQERIAQEARGRQMLGSMLQTAGSAASLIPGVGTAVGGGAQAVGGMLGGGGGGGIGGAVQGLMGNLSGQPQQSSPAPTGATAASLIGAQPQPMMQGAGAAAVNQSMAPPRTQAEYDFQQSLPQQQAQAAQAAHANFAEQLRQRRESLFAPTGQGGAWWRNGQ